MHERAEADAGCMGVRLTLPLACRAGTSEVVLEPAHCEWLFRLAAYSAVRDGRVGMGEQVVCRLVPGVVRDHHQSALCLASLAIELHDARGRLAARTDVSAEVFAPFVEARAARLWARAAVDGGTELGPVRFTLHAGPAVESPFPVSIPRLPSVSLATLSEARAVGKPDRGWVTTVIEPAVITGLDALETMSRSLGVEAAGRIHGRVGFDAERRCFVRVLEQLVPTRETTANATAVLSRAESWGEFLASVPSDGPSAGSQAHTHLHTRRPDGSEGDGLDATAPPVISADDRISLLVDYPDSLSASLILSLYDDRRVLKIYGCAADGRLREEPGWFLHPGSAAAMRLPDPEWEVSA